MFVAVDEVGDEGDGVWMTSEGLTMSSEGLVSLRVNVGPQSQRPDPAGLM